jgi:hypothetical protein
VRLSGEHGLIGHVLCSDLQHPCGGAGRRRYCGHNASPEICRAQRSTREPQSGQPPFQQGEASTVATRQAKASLVREMSGRQFERQPER